MYCKYCKANNINGNIYCFSCGAKLPVLSPPPSAAASKERPGSEYDNAINWKRVGYWATVIVAGAATAFVIFMIFVHFV